VTDVLKRRRALVRNNAFWKRGPNVLLIREVQFSWTPLWILHCMAGSTEQGNNNLTAGVI